MRRAQEAVQREAVFAVEKIDQGYRLNQAIPAFASTKDRAGEEDRRKELQQEMQRLEAEIARHQGRDLKSKRVQWYNPRTGKHLLLGHESLESSQEGIAAWRSVPQDMDYAGWFECKPAFTTSESRHVANQAQIQSNKIMLQLLPRGYSTSDPITRGLMAALQERTAVAYGRLGGLQCPKMKVDADIWNGEWQFEPEEGLAKGGVPQVEIHDVTIFPSEHVLQLERKARDALPALPRAREKELRAFLNKLGPRSEEDAWRAAEAHFRAKIPRQQIRDGRSAKGISGRPRKSRREGDGEIPQ